jgi:tetratricopeptide (TPR) repeat protein
MPPPLLRPKDVPAPAWFGRYNFQREEDLARLTTILGSPGGPSVVLLAGEPGIGRRYLLQAAAHRLCQAGRPVEEILEIDLEGYGEEMSLSRFLELQLEKRRTAEWERRREITAAVGQATSLGLKGTGAAALLSILLGLKEPIAALRKVFGGAEEGFSGELFSPREAFASFLSGLSGRVILHVTDPTLFHTVPSPENPRRWLPEVAERFPHVVLVVSCGPAEHTEDVVPGARNEVERIELHRLEVHEVKRLLDLRLAPNSFPPNLGETLVRYSHGLPGLLGSTVWKLHVLEALDEDEALIWGVDDAKVAEVLSEGLLEELSQTFHAHPEHTRSLWIFLLDAALCGERVPASILLDVLADGEEGLRDELTDRIDEELVERLGVFEDLEYSHPSFPSSVGVYRFREPLLRLAILEHYSPTERRKRAAKIAPVLLHELPVRTRDVARLFVTLAEHLGDEERNEYLRELAWWVGVDEAEALRDGLATAVAEGSLEPEALWKAVKGTEGRWPAYRRLALLDAYGVGPCDDAGNPLGVPVERLGDFHLKRGELLREMGEYVEALYHAEHAESVNETMSGTKSLPYLAALRLVGMLLHSLGDLAQAKEKFEKALNISESISAAEVDWTLTTKGDLACVFQGLGDLARARELNEEVLAEQTRLLGPKHPDTLITKENLAVVFENQGDLERARLLLEEVLEAQTHLLGHEHHETLRANGNLAVILMEQGDLARSAQLHEKALETRARTLGLEHPDTLITKGNLAEVLENHGDLEKARLLLEEVLEAQGRRLGSEHPSTLVTKHRLASVFRGKGDLARALELAEEILEAQAHALGPAHPHTLATKHLLAEVFKGQGDLTRALELAEEVLEKEAQILGPEHPDTLMTKHLLAHVFENHGDLARAQDLMEEVLDAQARLLGSEHPHTLSTKHCLATVVEKRANSA